jgi:type II secretory pathway pseudopilin PulG
MSSSYRRLAILVISILSLVIVISLVAFVKQNEIGFETLQKRNQSDPIEKREGDTNQGIDPCNGTEGTGQIITIQEGAITIKKRDGKEEVVVLTGKTSYINSAGKATKAMLKVGDRVTVVIDDSNTAMAVLVCGIK